MAEKDKEDGALLQTITDSGQPARQRIKTPEGAYELFQALKADSDDRALQWAKIQGMYDRNPPYNPADLANSGRAYQTNVNTGEMESIIDSATTASHQAVFHVHALITCKIRPELVPPGTVQDHCAAIEEEYTDLLDSWSGFFQQADLATKEEAKYGVGGMIWPDEWNWKPRAYKSGNFLFPGQAATNTEDIEFFLVRDEIPARELFETAQKGKVSKEAGWDVPYLRKVLINTYKLGENQDDDTDQTSIWETLQSKIRNNDTETEKKEFVGVKVVHILVREVDPEKGITHFIIPEGMTDKGFIFERQSRFERMDQVLWVLLHDNGTGEIKSVKGRGHRAFMHCDLSNRTFGAIMDGGQFAASLMVQPQTAVDTTNLQIMKVGGMMVIPSELNIVQSSFTPPINHLIPLRDMSSRILSNNMGITQNQSENPLSNSGEKTAAEVQSNDTREATFNQGQSMYRYLAWDRWHREVFRRLTNVDYLTNGFTDIDDLVEVIRDSATLDEVLEAKSGTLDFLPGQEEAIEFFRNCINRGVPAAVLLTPKALKLRTTRAIGLGSESERRRAVNSLMGVRSGMDEFSRRNAEREWAASQLGGYQNVDRFFPLVDRSKVPNSETVIATLENNDMAEGSQIPVGADQFHAVHIPVHMSLVIQMAKAFQENPGQVNVPKAVQLLGLEIPHLMAHLRFLSRDDTRKEQVEQFSNTLKEFVKIFQKMKAASGQIEAEQQQAQQAETDRVSQLESQANKNEVELAARKHEIDRRMELDQLETQNLNATRIAKLEVSIEALIRKTDASIVAEARRTDSEIRTKEALAASEAAIKSRNGGGDE